MPGRSPLTWHLSVAGEQGVTTANVLIEAQPAARPQDPAEFGERRLDVDHRAHRPGDHDRIELPVSRRQVSGGAVDHPDQDRGRRGGPERAVAQVSCVGTGDYRQSSMT